MMNSTDHILKIQPPASMGLLLSYRCNTTCRYCIYASSPAWESDWIGYKDAEMILSNTARIFEQVYPESTYSIKRDQISFDYGIHFTGGEPFLNFKLLVRLAETAFRFNIPSPFVETNCFWAKDDRVTEEKLTMLKEAGLAGILISVNPFTIEYIPFERIDRAVTIGHRIFGSNLIIYQNFYLNLFRKMNLKDKLAFEDFLKMIELKEFYNYIELLPMGRAPYTLGELFRKYPAESFLQESCYPEMTRNWHTHVDNYCNYIPGFCAGISLGDFRDYNSLFVRGIDLNDRPVIRALTSNLAELLEMGKQFGFRENKKGYISKCHLCAEIRRSIVKRTTEFKELAPVQFYENLD